nr:uncharacterized protein LOC116431550 isoform X10 [Nomia melanderi]
MAEVATKKSISVVSNKKSEVCSGVQSNNGLLDLDNLTASNNQLISLCDTNDDEDDLILTNNTRNELDTDDKSLQELIESELALRISSSNNQDTVVDNDDNEEPASQPETVKRIVLDRRQDTLDINTEFIVAEAEHCALIEEPYSYQNGHVSPDTKISSSSYEETVKPEPVVTGFRDEEEEQVFAEEPEVGSVIVVEKTINDEIDRSTCEPADDGRLYDQNQEDDEIPNDSVPRASETEDRPSEMPTLADESFDPVHGVVPEEETTMPASCVDKYQEEEDVQSMVLEDKESEAMQTTDSRPEDDNSRMRNVDTWSEQVTFQEGQQAGQFSDNFDLCQQSLEICNSREFEEGSSLFQTGKSDDIFEPVMTEPGKEDTDDVNELPVEEESKVSLDDRSSSSVDEKIPEDPEDCSTPVKPVDDPEDDAQEVSTMQSRSFEDVTLSHSEASTDAVSTQEFIDTERRVLSEEIDAERLQDEVQAPDSPCLEKIEPPANLLDIDEEIATKEDNADEQNAIAESSSELSVSEPTFIEKTEVNVSDGNATAYSDARCLEPGTDSELIEDTENPDLNSRAPLATPDDEASDVSNACDSESREETITTTTSVVTSSKSGTKTKKKKIEGVAGNDASPNLTPRTKKTKKSKKNELEKENISVVGQNGDTNPNCRSCGKVVFQMEQTKAEGLVWHKNCFRCVQCSKQLNVDNYESHESTLYCKPHFKELFQPKPVEESEQPVRPRKPELIIRENEPKELPPDVVRASDKPDLGLEELSSLNVKSRFQVFEKAGAEANEIERSPSQVAVKRSPSILSKLAKFQAKGMDIGVADESLNGIPYEESSESEEEEEAEETEETETEIVKAKRATRERPISFTKMDDIKNRWETTSQQGRRKVQREARKEEIAGIRSRLFMGKQGKMKEMYQQAVAGSDRVTKINPAEELQNSSAHARSIKERFERGELIGASDDETDNKPKPEKADEEVIAAGISRKSRSLFLELDASAAKTGRPVTPVNPKTPSETPRRARDAFMGRQVSDDVVRSSDTTEEVQVETSDISNKFKFFESYKEPEKERKQFRITPPRDGQVKMDSPEREIYRDPDVVRAEDRVDEVVRTDTARKMLSIFRQMEENATKKEVPNGPKPLKRFTPPPEDKYAKPTASDSEEEEEEEGEESEGEDSAEERDPNYVRASDKVEDEFLKQAQNAARAKTLCAKFEHWDETDAKTVTSSNQHIAEMEIAQSTGGDQASIESASSLRARFESLGSQQTEPSRTTKVKVNRFV